LLKTIWQNAVVTNVECTVKC